MLNVQMSPGVREASPTNGIGQVILNYAKHLSDFGVRLVSAAESHDLTAAHAGAALADVAHLHGVAAVTQPQRHAHSHVPDPEDGDCGQGVHDCTSRRLLATDIRMPSPRPSVTIAVPP